MTKPAGYALCRGDDHLFSITTGLRANGINECYIHDSLGQHAHLLFRASTKSIVDSASRLKSGGEHLTSHKDLSTETGRTLARFRVAYDSTQGRHVAQLLDPNPASTVSALPAWAKRDPWRPPYQIPGPLRREGIVEVTVLAKGQSSNFSTGPNASMIPFGGRSPAVLGLRWKST